jgi:hypothetical protein
MLALRRRTFITLSTAGLAMAMAAAAGASAAPVIGIVDARQGARLASITWPAAGGPRLKHLKVLDLSGAPDAPLRCCVSSRGAVVVHSDATLTVDGRPQPVRTAPARLTGEDAAAFLGLAIGGGEPHLERLSANELRLRWRAPARSVGVAHCLSAEGWHVRWFDVDTRAELGRYYVPLGMAVEATCTEALMPGAGGGR